MSPLGLIPRPLRGYQPSVQICNCASAHVTVQSWWGELGELGLRVDWLWGRWLCHITGLDGYRGINLQELARPGCPDWHGIIRQQAVIERLEKRIAQCGRPSQTPKLPPDARSEAQSVIMGASTSQGATQTPAAWAIARSRMTPTHRVEHVVEQCPDCGTHLSGGWAQRTREVIDLPQVPAQVTEQRLPGPHLSTDADAAVFPKHNWTVVVMGKQRLGVNVISLIAALREEARLTVTHHPMVPGAPLHGLRHQTWAPS